MADFRCGPARDLPIKDGVAFDRSGAIASMLDAAGIGGDNADFVKARRGFLIYDAEKPELRGSYHLPFATVENGALTAIGNGIRNAAGRLPQMDGVPDDVRAAARRVLDAYMAKQHDMAGKSAFGIAEPAIQISVRPSVDRLSTSGRQTSKLGPAGQRHSVILLSK